MTDSKEALIERLKRTANAVDLLDSGSRYTISMRRETKAVLLAAADALASLSASVGVTVKPLVWREKNGGDWVANSVVGIYSAGVVRGAYMVILRATDEDDTSDIIVAKGLPDYRAAHAAAQMHFEASIMSALPLPSSGGEVVIWVSSKQRQNLVQGGYVAARAAPEGNFDTPLYARATESGK